jgi:peptidylprolyl isomerase
MKLFYNLIFLIISLHAFRSNAQTEVTFYTNQGNFVVELYDSAMPITAGNFASLVKAKFYDGVIFHRVINNFMIQGGDPTGTGSGGPGYTIPDEFVTGISNIQKTISMANAGPNTGGSQFFINLVNNTFLDFDKAPLTSAHPVFGITKTNFNIVQAIGAVATNSADRPLTDVIMDSIRITKVGTLSISTANNFMQQIDIYPNPIGTESYLSFNLKNACDVHISLLNTNGQIIYTSTQYSPAGATKWSLHQLPIHTLAKGNYFIALSDGKHFVHKKVTIQ